MYPFIYLSNDGIWELEGEGKIHTKGHHLEKELSAKKVRGGFTEEIYSILMQNPTLITAIAQDLLEQNFPDSMHEDILAWLAFSCNLARLKEIQNSAEEFSRLTSIFKWIEERW